MELSTSISIPSGNPLREIVFAEMTEEYIRLKAAITNTGITKTPITEFLIFLKWKRGAPRVLIYPFFLD
jgi:hypothetical protein